MSAINVQKSLSTTIKQPLMHHHHHHHHHHRHRLNSIACRLLNTAPPQRHPFSNARTSATMIKTPGSDWPPATDSICREKQSLRSKIRRLLKIMDPVLRSREDEVIQRIVLESSWFNESKSLCAYISSASLREVDTSKIVSESLSPVEEEGNVRSRKRLYLPRVEDRNSNMRMLRISSVDDLVLNSMNILEPSHVDSEGNQREDVMQASEAVDLIILPGLAFDRSGNRLGRNGGYYDVFLKKYHDLVKERKWKQPLLVALAYSVQILEEEAVPITPYDVAVDALVSPAGFMPINHMAFEGL